MGRKIAIFAAHPRMCCTSCNKNCEGLCFIKKQVAKNMCMRICEVQSLQAAITKFPWGTIMDDHVRVSSTVGSKHCTLWGRKTCWTYAACNDVELEIYVQENYILYKERMPVTSHISSTWMTKGLHGNTNHEKLSQQMCRLLWKHAVDVLILWKTVTTNTHKECTHLEVRLLQKSFSMETGFARIGHKSVHRIWELQTAKSASHKKENYVQNGLLS